VGIVKRLILAVVVVIALLPGSATAAVQGSPDLSVTLENDTVDPGTDTTLRVKLVNEGDLKFGSDRNPTLNKQVTTARGVNISLDTSDAPFEVETDSRTVGRLPQGSSPALGFQVSVPEDVSPGTYTVPVTVSYTHTYLINEQTDARHTRDIERTFEVTVEVRETPRFRVVEAENDIRVGATGTVDLTVRNVGSAPARETSVAVTSRNGDISVGGVQSASRFVGSWGAGENRTISYQATAAPDAAAQRYAFTATASYETDDGASGQSGPLRFAVRPAPEQRFVVESATSDVAVGEDGNVSVTLRNDGPTRVRDATVELASDQSFIQFGNASRVRRFVGSWAPDETRTVEFEVQAAPNAEPRSYALTTAVTYRDSDGDRQRVRGGSLGVAPAPEPAEPSFALSNRSGTLRVGADGQLRGTVVNRGDAVADDATVTLRSPGSGLTAETTEVPVGDLAPGERASFAFDLSVSADAAAGPRQFTLVPEYRNEDDDLRTGDALTLRRSIREERDTFGVEATNGSVAPGDTTAYTVAVTNTGDEPVRDISAKLFADDPATAIDDEAYVPALAPGESATLTFEVEAGGDAMPKAYPLSVDLQYDDADGDTEVADSKQLALNVVEPSDSGGGGLPVTLLGGVGALALIGAGAYVRFG
jgi:hypothetical protein